MTMGEKILNMRKARGWSQEELAERIGVTRQAVSRWEAGAAKPDADKIIAVCDLFGVSADYLLRDQYPGEGAAPAAVTVAQKPGTALGDAIRAWTLDQWIGGLLIGAGAIVMMVLAVLSGIHPCYYNEYSGLIAYLLTYRIVWLWWLAVAGMVWGCWMLFLRKRLRKEWEKFRPMDG